MEKQPLISLITVNWNGLQYLKPLFDSLRKVTYPNIEIILSDNASTDESVEFTRKNYPEVIIHQNPENYMFARGNNEAIKIANGEIICLINNDVVVEPDFLEPIVAEFVEEPELAACQPKILDMNKPEYFEYAGAAGGFLDRYGYPFLRGRIFFTLEKDEHQFDDNAEVFWASGACLFLRKSVLDEVGLLDEDFVLHMEEIDLCWRIQLHGGKIRAIGNSRVYHKGGGTLEAGNPRKVFWNYRNNIFLLVKNLSGVNLSRFLIARMLLDKIAFWGELAKTNGAGAVAIIKAYFWVFTHMGLILSKRRDVQKSRKVDDKTALRNIYPGSIVWEYFFRGKRNFLALKRINSILD